MTGPNTNITTFEQAITQLRTTRAAGHFIDWDRTHDTPDVDQAKGITVEGYLSAQDIEALYLLTRPAAASA